MKEFHWKSWKKKLGICVGISYKITYKDSRKKILQSINVCLWKHLWESCYSSSSDFREDFSQNSNSEWRIFLGVCSIIFQYMLQEAFESIYILKISEIFLCGDSFKNFWLSSSEHYWKIPQSSVQRVHPRNPTKRFCRISSRNSTQFNVGVSSEISMKIFQLYISQEQTLQFYQDGTRVIWSFPEKPRTNVLRESRRKHTNELRIYPCKNSNENLEKKILGISAKISTWKKFWRHFEITS